jgi:alpha-glucosidase (family GH31 glycosyl hydrolase)
MKLTLAEAPADFRLEAGESLIVDLREGGHWYGHGFNHDQPYPLDSAEVVNPRFAVNNIQCPVWMGSKGYLLFAETFAPLEVSINAGGDGLLNIRCECEAMTIRTFRGTDLPEAHRQWLTHIGWPNQAASESLFGDAFFCTWTQYPRCINQKRILDMGKAIRKHGYPCKRLLIDDRWENCFGELEFAGKDFPDPAGMIKELRAMGFEVWLWVTPFVNQEATGFEELAARNVLVPRKSGPGAATFRWWGGTAGLVDLTGPTGRDWYQAKLQALLDLGVEGFKIDGGDYKYQPDAADSAWHADPGASGYSDTLLAFFEQSVPNRCETRAAWISQKRSVIWREGGKDSHWGLDNGLKALLTLGLHLGLMGYDQLIPDMVPGRVQTMRDDHPLASDELMVRWTECSAFFPFLQFSYFPWNYAEPTAETIAAYAHLHKALEPYISEQAQNRTAPLIRPLWYDQPDDQSLYAIDDCFQLGGDLVIAPVLDAGVRSRDITLPNGNWVDAWTGNAHQGKLSKWPAPCPGIPVFVHSRNPELYRVLNPALSRIQRGRVSSGTTTHWKAGLNRDLNVTG